MDTYQQQHTNIDIASFRLPRYHEIPTMGLYLEQVIRYVNEYLDALGCAAITSSMVSNYVKRKIIPGPTKKTYGAEAIAYLIFVSFAKTVMSMDDIRLLEEVQRETYTSERAYDYFCNEFENILRMIFEGKPPAEMIDIAHTSTKNLLNSALLSLVHKIYLETCFKELRSSRASR